MLIDGEIYTPSEATRKSLRQEGGPLDRAKRRKDRGLANGHDYSSEKTPSNYSGSLANLKPNEKNACCRKWASGRRRAGSRGNQPESDDLLASARSGFACA